MRLHSIVEPVRRSRLFLAVPLIAAWLILPLAGSAGSTSSDRPAAQPAVATGAPAESSPANNPDGVLRVGGDVSAPRVVRRVEPVYPVGARARRVQGVVIVEAVIDEKGHVESTRVLKQLPFGLTESAVAAIEQSEFTPALHHGEPVRVIFNLTINYRMDEAPLRNPLASGKVTSRFGESRSGSDGKEATHSGIDLAAPRGTPVISPASGKVVRATAFDSSRPEGGATVIIDHGKGLRTVFSSLETMSVSEGQEIEAGATIGTVGAYGTGPHLHFETLEVDEPFDPVLLFSDWQQ